jgi:hypothetical protein
MLHPITCPTCNTAAGFTQTYQGPYVLNALPCIVAYLTSVRDMDILNNNSPNYAARDACIVDRDEYRAVLSFIYHFTQHPAEGVGSFNLPSSTVFRILSNYLDNGLRVITPELLETELKIMFHNIIFDYLVRQQGSPYYTLLPNFTTEDAKVNHERQDVIVRAVKDLHTYFRDLHKMWDGIIKWCVSVLAVKWGERFQ